MAEWILLVLVKQNIDILIIMTDPDYISADILFEKKNTRLLLRSKKYLKENFGGVFVKKNKNIAIYTVTTYHFLS